jgi:hypothetical protein
MAAGEPSEDYQWVLIPEEFDAFRTKDAAVQRSQEEVGSARYIALGGFMHLARRQFLRLAAGAAGLPAAVRISANLSCAAGEADHRIPRGRRGRHCCEDFRTLVV